MSVLLCHNLFNGITFEQLMVDKVEFKTAKPDILARTGPEIVERLNSRGQVLEDALKSVCLHRKGLKVEVNFLYCEFYVSL